MKIVVDPRVLSQVAGGGPIAVVTGPGSVVNPVTAASLVAAAAGASVAFQHVTVGGVLAAGPVAAGTYMTGLIAAATLGYQAGTQLNKIKAVQETAEGTVERFIKQGVNAPYCGLQDIFGGKSTDVQCSWNVGG